MNEINEINEINRLSNKRTSFEFDDSASDSKPP